MTNQELSVLNEAADRISGWRETVEQLKSARMPRLLERGYYGARDDMILPEHLWLSYRDKLVQWAQEGLAKAEEDFARL